MGAMRAKRSGYDTIEDVEHGNDHELMHMDATYIPRAETWNGFQAALEMPSLQGMPPHELENASDLTPELRSFVESMRKAVDALHFGLSFAYSDLSFQPKGSKKMILQNVTGLIERGSLVAVMGGSGAGKSTFVNVLMGKTVNTGGSVTINNTSGKLSR
jgi:ABC-type multidrug transport system fused ATPase/permease subunit